MLDHKIAYSRISYCSLKQNEIQTMKVTEWQKSINNIIFSFVKKINELN